MPVFPHGKAGVFKLGDLANTLTDISLFVDDVKPSWKTDRPVTTTLGRFGEKHEVTGLREGTIGVNGLVSHVTAGAGGGVKLHGKSVRIIHDQYPLTLAPTNDLFKGSIKREIVVNPTQVFADTWKRFNTAAKGLMKAAISFDGYFDGTTGAIDAVYRSSVGIDPPGQNIFSVGLNGFAIGNLVEMFQAVQTNYGLNSSPSKLVDVTGTFDSDDQFDLGVSLHDLVSEVGAAPVLYASVDETVATTSTGALSLLVAVGHLHVTAFVGTTAVFKIQHSTDNSVWVDLITFAAVTAAGVQRIEVAAGTTINRYVRGQLFTATYTSATFNLSFARRGYAYGAAGTHRHWCGLLTYGSPGFAGPIGGNTGFEYGPAGASVGSRKWSAPGGATPAIGLVLKDYTASFDENGLTKFSAMLMTDGGPVTESTY